MPYSSINMNCVDPLGRTALLIAIENDNIEMIDLLLRFDVQMGDALLHAINEDNVEATQLLLAHLHSVKKDSTVRENRTVMEKRQAGRIVASGLVHFETTSYRDKTKVKT